MKSRREFLGGCLAAGGSLTLGFACAGGGGCRGTSEPAVRAREAEPLGAAPREAAFEAGYLRLEREGELKRREETLWKIFERCRCCPRGCGVNRLDGEKGICSSSAVLKVASAGPHFGEEPPLVGRRGSGTIFFSNCSLLCIFCQNWTINHHGEGDAVSHEDLAEMMLSLQRRGCHNINLVTPSHVVPHIVRALRIAIRGGLTAPLVYNTGGYDSLEVLQLLDGVVDIYLPDFKYQDNEIATRLSTGAEDYPEVAAAAIKEMHRQVGDIDQIDGIARRGLMMRHLVLPNRQAGTDRFVEFVARELSVDTYVNIMGQYRPLNRANEFEEVSRRVTRAEMAEALAWAREAGLTRIQGG